jgi:hypothetical protein
MSPDATLLERRRSTTVMSSVVLPKGVINRSYVHSVAFRLFHPLSTSLVSLSAHSVILTSVLFSLTIHQSTFIPNCCQREFQSH